MDHRFIEIIIFPEYGKIQSASKTTAHLRGYKGTQRHYTNGHKNWQMEFNANKCHVIRYGVGAKRTDEVKTRKR